MSLQRRSGSNRRDSDPQVAPDGFQIRGGYSVTGLLRTVGCVMGPCSLARLAGTLPPHADLVRGSCFDLTRGSSFSCFGVRPATLANLSVEEVSAGNAWIPTMDTGVWIPGDVRPRESAVLFDVELGHRRFLSRLPADFFRARPARCRFWH